ncbi:MAG: hypothetical protein KIT45_13785 [Fimbriimonadia bacterium]|nr:hypothetical protein [Fimbriimonadia bacterium]
MSLKILEGSWEEIREREAELQGHRLRVIVLPERMETQLTPLTGKELLQYLIQIGFVGEWSDRLDIPDSAEYSRQLRHQAEMRGASPK